ncbi:MAG: argininosuccinate lyase [Verrucomicrobiales bacterium]|jgi:argininosuccinate lyase|nr:argininosuccinate lyase [Verrucomicrobiales bacterium]
MKPSPSAKDQALWGGRFAAAPDQLVQDYTKSVQYDWRLWRADIFGSLAHARMLREIGVLTVSEFRAIERGLREIFAEIETGVFQWDAAREDVHMNIEAALTAKTPAGAKLHTGRSRNDQVATDLRLWVKNSIAADGDAIRALQRALVALARKDQQVHLPGYTHLQRAQPVYFAHHLLAYVEMLARDADRLADCQRRADVLPLGAGALAGSTIPLRRERVAQLLGFATVTQNSLDAVSDRDFIVEYAAASALLAVHLSRLAEDLVLWSSAEFNFIRIGDAFTTGSSLMPQKKNPDVAELARGKSGRVIGNLVALLTLVKGLPMSYNRDLQEDKERLFDTVDTVRATLTVLAAMLGDTRVNAAACARAVADPLLLATDVADWLVNRGVPFRRAHEVVGRAVAASEQRGMPLDKLPLTVWKKLHPACDASLKKIFNVSAALDRRQMTGAPGRQQVAAQLRRWGKILH